MADEILDATAVRALFDYSPDTGEIRWKVKPCRRIVAGQLAGSHNGHGYLRVKVDKRDYMVHRLAWAYVHGAWPLGDIDHINGIRTDNRIQNLRDVARTVNCENQRRARSDNLSTGLLGVTIHKRTGLFVAYITTSGKQRNLGYFKTGEEAHAAYLAAKREVHAGCMI